MPSPFPSYPYPAAAYVPPAPAHISYPQTAPPGAIAPLGQVFPYGDFRSPYSTYHPAATAAAGSYYLAATPAASGLPFGAALPGTQVALPGHQPPPHHHPYHSPYVQYPFPTAASRMMAPFLNLGEYHYEKAASMNEK